MEGLVIIPEAEGAEELFAVPEEAEELLIVDEGAEEQVTVPEEAEEQLIVAEGAEDIKEGIEEGIEEVIEELEVGLGYIASRHS